MARITKKVRKRWYQGMRFWAIHALHWTGAFLFILITLTLLYILHPGAPVVASQAGF